MTPSERAKELGCKSLAQVAKAVGQSVQTLINWFSSRPKVFDACCEFAAREDSAGEAKDV
ncbi:MAG: hypothetical protein ACRCYD_15985 [Plesiomonas sp.]